MKNWIYLLGLTLILFVAGLGSASASQTLYNGTAAFTVQSTDLDKEDVEQEKEDDSFMDKVGEMFESEDEEKIEFKNLPPAVQDTVKREAGNSKIDELSKETEDGKTFFEIEFKQNGREVEIKIAENGAVLEREIE